MSTLIPYSIRRNFIPIAALAAALATGAVIGFFIPLLSGQSLYRVIMIGLGAFILLGLVLSGAPQRILIIALAVSIPINLAFSPFHDVPLHEGGAPPGFLLYLYDVPVFALFGIWILEVLFGKR